MLNAVECISLKKKKKKKKNIVNLIKKYNHIIM